MHKAMPRNQGFTLIELIIVIVVIAVLAAITITTYSGIQDRAKVASIVSGLRQTDKTMRLALLDEGRSTWWDNRNYLDENGESSLLALIEQTSLGNYMSFPPRVNGEDDSFWMYDNDIPTGGDIFYDPTICPSAHRSGGVNLQIELRGNLRLAQRIDDMIDDGNLLCGRFRQHHNNPNEFIYLLSQYENMF